MAASAGREVLANLLTFLLAFAVVTDQAAAQSSGSLAAPAINLASVEANVAGLAILSLMLLATITAVLHLIGRRVWTRRVNELEKELAGTNAKLDRAALMLRSEPQNSGLMGASKRRADDRGGFRSRRQLAAVVARAQFCFMARADCRRQS